MIKVLECGIELKLHFIRVETTHTSKTLPNSFSAIAKLKAPYIMLTNDLSIFLSVSDQFRLKR